MASNQFSDIRSTYHLDSSASEASSDSEQEGDFPDILGRRRRRGATLTQLQQQHVLNRPTPEHAPDASTSSQSRVTATQSANSKGRKPKKPLRILTPKTSSLILALRAFSIREPDESATATSSSSQSSTSTAIADVKQKKPRNKLIRASRRRNSEPVVVTSVQDADTSGLSTKLNHLEIAPTASADATPKQSAKRHKRRSSEVQTEAQNSSANLDSAKSTPVPTAPALPPRPATKRPRPRLSIITHRHGRSASTSDVPVAFPSITSPHKLTQYRTRSPVSSSSSSSPAANAPPSPIPSFPPWTPRSSIAGDEGVSIVQAPLANSEQAPLTPSNPAYYYVPSTCDKRRRTVTQTTADALGELDDHPLKKRKQANGQALPSDPTSASAASSLLMPTAIDVVEFIRAKGGWCHEGDIFFRFRTGESEHVRSTVNVILEHFAIVEASGPGGRRRVTLRRGIARSSASSPVPSSP